MRFCQDLDGACTQVLRWFDLLFDEGSGTPGKSVSDWFNAAVSLLFGLFIWFSEVGRAVSVRASLMLSIARAT